MRTISTNQRRAASGAIAAAVLIACGADAPPSIDPPTEAPPPAATPESDAAAAPSDAAAAPPIGSDARPPAADAALPTTGDGFDCDAATCRDRATGLEWENPSGAATPTWDDAVRYCATLPLAGGGWRVPNVQELRSLIRGCPATQLGGPCRVHDPDCAIRDCMAGCDQCVFPVVNGQRHCTWPDALSGSCEHYHWSSTGYEASITPGVWYVDFGNGGWVHGAPKSIGGLVRCVRGASTL